LSSSVAAQGGFRFPFGLAHSICTPPARVPPADPYRQEFAMRPDVEAMKADIEQSVALLRRRL
jgi:hypothetical protein